MEGAPGGTTHARFPLEQATEKVFRRSRCRKFHSLGRLALWFMATESRYRCANPSPKFQVETPGMPRPVMVCTS